MKSYIKDYPRPQLVRQNWENLNGKWNFLFDDSDVGEKEKWYLKFPKASEINVPFTYETKLSGIEDTTVHEHVWYSRIFMAEAVKDKRLLLHFEGSDYKTSVWINGERVGEHTGGYARFSFDITKLVKSGENIITVKADDSLDRVQPRGKQRWIADNFACWYVQNTGIWKTVWLEYVPEAYIASVKLTPNLNSGSVELEADIVAASYSSKLIFEAEVSFGGRIINRASATVLERHVEMSVNLLTGTAPDSPEELYTWSPREPQLYDVSFKLLGGELPDEVGSYFGMREIRIDGENILLNGSPLYQRLILDQGYWKDSLLTPPNEEALIEDIDKIMQLGYNGVRKHQKVEDERFLYWADVKGLLVWSEVPATYVFSDEAVECFTREWMEIVRQNYSHPSIIIWTPFNESWGIHNIKFNRKQQCFTESIYNLTKAFDSMRPVITNDGWEHTISDIITLHDYEADGARFYEHYTQFKEQILSDEMYHSENKSAFAQGYGYHGQPVIISEFGGIALDGADSGWGYGEKVKGEESFLSRFESITMAIKNIPYICGYCYTQVTDVQQEINGLMDMERNFKVNPDKVREINLKKTEVKFGIYR